MSAKKQLPEKLVSCGVLVTKGEPIESFLLMVHKNRLDLPKGHVEPGESEIECAMRELEEETGIGVVDIRLDPTFRFTTEYTVRYKKFGRQPIPKTTIIFLGTLVRDVEIVVTEHLGFEWHAWSPPHTIQAETIDSLLAAAEQHLS